nr:MAG TPA: hypothetical protein [Caudoviricetes sp.]
MTIRLTFKLEDTHFRFEPVTKRYDLLEPAVREVFKPLDHHRGAAWSQFLCSDPREVMRVQMDRKRMAALIAEAITQAIMDEFGARDTVNGYPKEGA